jgi:hypothetical protein
MDTYRPRLRPVAFLPLRQTTVICYGLSFIGS